MKSNDLADIVDALEGMSDAELFQINDALARLMLAGLGDVAVKDVAGPAELVWETVRNRF